MATRPDRNIILDSQVGFQSLRCTSDNPWSRKRRLFESQTIWHGMVVLR